MAAQLGLFDVDVARGSGQTASHETQQGTATPDQSTSSAVGNVAEPDRTPSDHCGADASTSTFFDDTSIDARFERFHEENPHVLLEMLRLARARIAAGATRVGVKSLWEELRVTLRVSVRDDGDWKLNNSFTAPYARALIAAAPELGAFIETRRRKL